MQGTFIYPRLVSNTQLPSYNHACSMYQNSNKLIMIWFVLDLTSTVNSYLTLICIGVVHKLREYGWGGRGSAFAHACSCMGGEMFLESSHEHFQNLYFQNPPCKLNFFHNVHQLSQKWSDFENSLFSWKLIKFLKY